MKIKKRKTAKKINTVKSISEKAMRVMEKYKKEYPKVIMDRDYAPLKITEEWGECMQTYLMLTDRGRQKEKSKKEILHHLSEEVADVFGYLLIFAKTEKIDVSKAIEKKWFAYLKK